MFLVEKEVKTNDYFLVNRILLVMAESAERIKRKKKKIMRWILNERKNTNLTISATALNQRRFWIRLNLKGKHLDIETTVQLRITVDFVDDIWTFERDLLEEDTVLHLDNNFANIDPNRDRWHRNWNSKFSIMERRKNRTRQRRERILLADQHHSFHSGEHDCYHWEISRSAKWRNPMCEHFCRFYPIIWRN